MARLVLRQGISAIVGVWSFRRRNKPPVNRIMITSSDELVGVTIVKPYILIG
jgi:hypothetical protein